ncbi:MAG: Rho termination factor N-terminal domain-containing protein [Ilumatobacteraceae bacterium]
MDEFETSFSRRLAELEGQLPDIATKLLALGRAGADRVGAVASGIASDVGQRVSKASSDVGDAVSTTVGQTKSAAGRSAASVKSNTKEAVGQARAQATKSADAVDDAAGALLDDATRAVKPQPSRPSSLEKLTKQELYDRAQELDIDGRSAMNKSQLISAIRAH